MMRRDPGTTAETRAATLDAKSRRRAERRLATANYPAMPDGRWEALAAPSSHDGVDVVVARSRDEVLAHALAIDRPELTAPGEEEPGADHHLLVSVDGLPTVAACARRVLPEHPNGWQIRAAVGRRDATLAVAPHVADAIRRIGLELMRREGRLMDWHVPTDEAVERERRWVAGMAQHDDEVDVARVAATSCAFVLSGEWRDEEWLRVLLPTRADAMLGRERFARRNQRLHLVGHRDGLGRIQDAVHHRLGAGAAISMHDVGRAARRRAPLLMEMAAGAIAALRALGHDDDALEALLGEPGAGLSQLLIDAGTGTWLPTPQSERLDAPAGRRPTPRPDGRHPVAAHLRPW